MRVIKNYTTREDFLSIAFNEGIEKFEQLHDLVEHNDKPITDFKSLVELVIEAERCGILYQKSNKSIQHTSYLKNVRWYLGKLEREGKIKGFTSVVGRPKGSKNLNSSILESCLGLLDS